jgi:hypothetical protein
MKMLTIKKLQLKRSFWCTNRESKMGKWPWWTRWCASLKISTTWEVTSFMRNQWLSLCTSLQQFSRMLETVDWTTMGLTPPIKMEWMTVNTDQTLVKMSTLPTGSVCSLLSAALWHLEVLWRQVMVWWWDRAMPLRSLSMQSRMRNSTTKWTTSRGNSIKVEKNTPNSLDK